MQAYYIYFYVEERKEKREDRKSYELLIDFLSSLFPFSLFLFSLFSFLSSKRSFPLAHKHKPNFYRHKPSRYGILLAKIY